ncbi:MAG TPA: hypothetical protein VJS88_06590, partial [Chthoniobacterales bacterium]|nr:hypothetical protein [Chthoniobacterales bacterium]
DLMSNDELEYCLVVGAEEADWLLCDAYHKWRLLRAAPPIEPFAQPPRGTILSEGAGAILLSSEGRASARPILIERISGGTNFSHQRDAAKAVNEVFAELCQEAPDLIIPSANGTFVDDAERAAIAARCKETPLYAAKAALGESVGASSPWQTICAAEALLTNRIPGGSDHRPYQSAVVSTCGLNQQVAGLRLARSE